MFSINQRLCVLFIVCFILTGCSTAPIVVPSAPRLIPSQMDVVMQYYAGLLNLSEDERIAKYDSVKESFMQDESEENRIKYILLLILPNTQFRDLVGALNLLSEWSQEETLGTTSLNIFGLVLTQLVTEQQHLDNISRHAFQDLKIERERVEILQNKIDDIKAMEKNMIRRESF